VLTKAIIDIFGIASGLHINPIKCLINPIQCGLEDTLMLLQFFPGRLQSFPCKYLGVPLSTKQLSKTDLQPLVDRVVAGLTTWKAGLMTRASRAVLVRTNMSAIPVHTAIAMAISPWAVSVINNRRRAFLWKGTAPESCGQCRLAWPRV
jgi:hypothetical protein